MRYFWQGFESKTGAPIQFKKHVIVLFWSPDDGGDEVKSTVKRLSSRYPSVKVKVVNVKKDPTKPGKHGVARFPTVLLLKDGREVDRVSDAAGGTMLEQLFRKAHV